MSVTDASITSEEFNALRNSHNELQPMVQDLLTKLRSLTVASTLSPPVVPPVSPAAPTSPSRTFVPPISGAGVNAIITHDFKAEDLHKLDPTNRGTTRFGYKTPFTVLIPLQTYFDVLSFHVNNPAVTGVFYCYPAHLLKLVVEYKWSAMYNYHSVFFNRRRAEMAAGDYSQWGRCDNDLLSEYVYGHRKASSTK